MIYRARHEWNVQHHGIAPLMIINFHISMSRSRFLFLNAGESDLYEKRFNNMVLCQLFEKLWHPSIVIQKLQRCSYTNVANMYLIVE